MQWEQYGLPLYHVHTLSLSKNYQKTLKQHSYILLKNNPLNILCSILKTCFTRPLSCERPLKLSKDEDCLLFILRMFNAKMTKLPRSVRAPDPPKTDAIWVPISISLHKIPTLNLQFLTFILIIQEKWHNRKSLCRLVRFTKPGPQL